MQGLLLSIMNLQLVGAIPVHHSQTKYLPHIHPEHSLHMHTPTFYIVCKERERGMLGLCSQTLSSNLIRVKKPSRLSARGLPLIYRRGLRVQVITYIPFLPRLLFLVDVSLKPVF